MEDLKNFLPQFSILISVYRNEQSGYLKQALESVINQTYKPTEIVLVKDGLLTEELESCIRLFLNKYPNMFNILEFPNNRGLGLALRDGVEACKFEYIARMDTDDIANSQRFEKQFQYLNKHPETALLGTWITEFSKEERMPDTLTKLPCSHKEILEYAKKRNPFRHMTVVYKKKAVLDSGNYRDFLWFEDYDLWVRMLQKGYIVANIPEYLVNVRANNEMFARRGGRKYLKQEYKFQRFLLKEKFITVIDFFENIIIRTVVRIMPNVIRRYIYRKFLRNK